MWERLKHSFTQILKHIPATSDISRRLLIYILMFSSFATLLLTSVQLSVEYQKDLQTFHTRVTHIEEAFTSSITENYWNLNRGPLELLLEGIIKFDGIERVEIFTSEGSSFMVVGTTPQASAYLRQHKIALIYTGNNVKDYFLGNMVITGSLESVHHRLFERALTIIFSQAVKTFLVAVFILWLVHQLITRHLLGMADYIRSIKPSRNRKPLTLDRKDEDDELQLLSETINTAYASIHNREKSLSQAIKHKEQAEQQANHEKARVLTALEIIDDAIIITDENGAIAVINQTAQELFKAQETDLIGQPVNTLSHRLLHGTNAVNMEALAKSGDETYVKAQLINSGARNIPISLSVRPVLTRQSDSLQNCAIIICDLRQEQMSNRMLYLSTHDYLTHLPNRYSFEQSIQNLGNNLDNFPYVALGIFDLDKFKAVNDTCGHTAGDALLSQLSTILCSHFPESATLYRVGGDEFGLIAFCDTIEEIENLAHQCLTLIADYVFIWEHTQHFVTSSIGLSIYHKHASNARDLLVEADEACYRAKTQGGNQVVIQYAEDSARHADSIRSLNRLNKVLQKPDLTLFAQPILPCGKNLMHLVPRLEILLRYTNDKGIIETPLSLLEAGERYGKITTLDLWVIEEALQNANKLIDAGWFIDINISPQTLVSEKFMGFIEHQFPQYDFPQGSICFEITERQIVTNVNHTRNVMQRLEALGISFALDDFGQGFASYGFIRHLPISLIKLDGELIQKIAEDKTIQTMVSSIISMCQSLEIPVAAEYVSDSDILGLLNAMGASYIQGELVSLAQPLDTFYHKTPLDYAQFPTPDPAL